MFRSMFPGDIFAQMDRLQRELQQTFDLEPSIRGVARGNFPALNLCSTPESIEVFVFMPGLKPEAIDVQIEHGVLTIAGERADDLTTQSQQATVQVNERFAGRFKRVLTLPEQINPESVNAAYRDGVLHVSIARSQAAQPRQITVH
jgi:HSP20 family protein